MSWQLFLWLLEFICQAALLGRSMYVLLSLSELEADMLNPYDLSSRLNGFVMIELGVQIVAFVVVLMGGMWFAALLQGAILAYLIQQHLRKQVYVDATDAIRVLKPQQKWRMVLFGAYCVTFVFTTYRVIETIIHVVLTPEGREVAKKLFREAAHTLPAY